MLKFNLTCDQKSKLRKSLKELANIVNRMVKCGGPGSGVPGPCPDSFGQGRKPKPRPPAKPGSDAPAGHPAVTSSHAFGPVKDPKTATPPPPYKPNVEAKGKDGVTLAARVGVPANAVPVPPKIGSLPNLTVRERAVEHNFSQKFTKNPDGMSSKYKEMCLLVSKQKGEPPTFETDYAKSMTSAWNNKDLKTRLENRATLNTALHQTANAIAKRAFVQHLDTLKPGDEIMVTVGGCGAGKSFALDNIPQATAQKMKSKAIWDSAGDQNATENPWVLKEAEKRGLKVTYVHVHANPETQWSDKKRGVVQRAHNPENGRMVDAKVFADSYAIGNRNHQAFYEANKNNPNANFVFLKNGSPPETLSAMLPESLAYDRKHIANVASHYVETEPSVAPHVRRGALIGKRVWPGTDD